MSKSENGRVRARSPADFSRFLQDIASLYIQWTNSETVSWDRPNSLQFKWRSQGLNKTGPRETKVASCRAFSRGSTVVWSSASAALG